MKQRSGGWVEVLLFPRAHSYSRPPPPAQAASHFFDRDAWAAPAVRPWGSRRPPPHCVCSGALAKRQLSRPRGLAWRPKGPRRQRRPAPRPGNEAGHPRQSRARAGGPSWEDPLARLRAGAPRAGILERCGPGRWAGRSLDCQHLGAARVTGTLGWAAAAPAAHGAGVAPPRPPSTLLAGPREGAWPGWCAAFGPRERPRPDPPPPPCQCAALGLRAPPPRFFPACPSQGGASPPSLPPPKATQAGGSVANARQPQRSLPFPGGGGDRAGEGRRGREGSGARLLTVLRWPAIRAWAPSAPLAPRRRGLRARGSSLAAAAQEKGAAKRTAQSVQGRRPQSRSMMLLPPPPPLSPAGHATRPAAAARREEAALLRWGGGVRGEGRGAGPTCCPPARMTRRPASPPH